GKNRRDSNMEIVRPDTKRPQGKETKQTDKKPAADQTTTPTTEAPPQQDKTKLAQGQQAELNSRDRINKPDDSQTRKQDTVAETHATSNAVGANTARSETNATTTNAGGLSEEEGLALAATNEDSPVQAYESLSIKVAQKYFFDRTFGGALV